MTSLRFLRITEYRLRVYGRTWKGSVANSIANPILFLLAMGMGVGELVDANDPASLAGVDYLVFLAPGLMAATAMNVAVNESTYPIMASVKWLPIAFGQIATPLRPGDIALGQLAWNGLRILWASAVFVVVMVFFGAVESVWVLAAIVGALLTGLAYGAPITAWAITLHDDHAFPPLLRFVIMPMFLFSGAFFPIEQLPALIRPVAWFVPLWHGVRLCRTLALGEATLWASLGHVAVLGAVAAVGALLAMRNYRRRLLL